MRFRISFTQVQRNVMHHRYGRYGPHAWLRWYKRHYGHKLPVIVPTVAVVPVPQNTERVIFIIMSNDPRDDANQGNENPTPPEGMPALTGPRTSQQKEGDTVTFDAVKNEIVMEARTRALRDKNRKDIPESDELREEIEEAANNFIQTHPSLMSSSIDILSFIEYFKNTYFAVYLSSLGGSASDPEKFFRENSTRSIRKRAERDRKLDATRRSDITINEREYQGAIRIAELFRERGRNYDIREIAYHVPTYVRFYGVDGDD